MGLGVKQTNKGGITMQIEEKKFKEMEAAFNREQERKQKEKRYWVKQQLILEKARKAGITVTEAEIDQRLKA